VSSGLAQRIASVLERAAPSTSVFPVREQDRRLSGLDLFVLWGDLSVGLLVLVTGTLLVPALGFRSALLAILVGSVIGCLPLALVGLAGAREGVPGMVLFRPVLGIRGSFVPSALNLVQLLGWTAFEFWAMASIANDVSTKLWHLDAYALWLVVVAVGCTALAIGGPILVVRRWLERFGVYVVLAVGAWITFKVVTTGGGLSDAWHFHGTGGLPFWLAVDLVIAQPASWLPLVADYNRFARDPRKAAVGTFAGYAFGNAWFYALGALLVLGAGLSDGTPAGLAVAISGLAGGWIVLLALLAGETDEAFADIYSAAVSAQNLRERLGQRRTILAVAVAGTLLAAWLGGRPDTALGTFESFLFLLGSIFVPLFGVFLADYFALRRRSFGEEALFGPGANRGVRPTALAAWAAGFVVYQWAVPTGPAGWQRLVERVLHGRLRLPFPLAGSVAGASAPAFAAAFGLYLVLEVSTRRFRARRRATTRRMR
jgi:putative hydroxymethylpyrimidine transporter CytX